MKKKKGFTLIELLAVIVILAIIALIAVPIILNLIEKARKGAAQDSANGLRKAAQLYYSSNLIDNFTGTNIIFECNGKKCEASTGEFLEIDGTIPTSGSVEIKSDGEMIFSNIIINGYSCEIPKNGNSVCTKSTDESTDDSAITLGEIEVTVNSIVIPYTLNGETSSDVALNNDFSDSETVLLAYNDSKFENSEILLLNDSESNVTCEYGTSESYGESGILQNNSCYITGLDANTTYYYKLTVTDSNGDVHIKSGNVGTPAYVPGKVVYYNPFAGETCYDYNLSNSLTGYNGDNGNSNNNYQNACLKWYIITTNDDSSKENIDVILDHNTTPLVAWNMNATDNSAGMANVSWELADDTALWDGVLGVRLITADEIANITGASSDNAIKWSSTKTVKLMDDENADINVNLDNEMSWFYFDGKGSSYNKSANGWQLATAKSAGASKYAWLYDNLGDCMNNGCNYEDDAYYEYTEYEGSGNRKIQGYWTSTPVTGDSENAWGVKYIGNLARGKIYESFLGIRPVITISKDSLKVKKINSNDYIPEFGGPSVSIGEVATPSSQIRVSFTANSDFGINQVVCEYGLDEKYGFTGSLSGRNDSGTCSFNDLNDNTEYFYKITVIDRFNKSTIVTGSATTDVSYGDSEDEPETLENKQYTSGDAVTIGGYNWHVISDDGTYVTLLMDSGQIGEMNHCTLDANNETDCAGEEVPISGGTYIKYIYSWDKSLIRTYFKETLEQELLSEINNVIQTEICADASTTNGTNYGGYLISEINAINGASCNTTVNDYVRLATISEHYNLVTYSDGNEYPSLSGITKLETSEWYDSASLASWWGMSASESSTEFSFSLIDGLSGEQSAADLLDVRPVITIQKQ